MIDLFNEFADVLAGWNYTCKGHWVEGLGSLLTSKFVGRLPAEGWLRRFWHGIPFEVLVVVHVYREEQHGEEIIRIISARAAEKNEVRRYQRQGLA